MKHERSCGGIVFRGCGNSLRVLLIRHVNGGHWAFPKGHVEGNETETETALREIKEETGLDVALDTGFRHVTTYSPYEGTIKDVVYFIAKPRSGRLLTQEAEVSGAGWFTPEEAKVTVTFANDLKILDAAVDYVKHLSME